MISAISGYVIDVCLFVCQQAYLVKLGGEVEHGPKGVFLHELLSPAAGLDVL